jgi:hypothetical protein
LSQNLLQSFVIWPATPHKLWENNLLLKMSRPERLSSAMSFCLATLVELQGNSGYVTSELPTTQFGGHNSQLKVIFKYFPLDGRNNLVENVSRCRGDGAIRQRADSLGSGILRPVLSSIHTFNLRTDIPATSISCARSA